MCLLCWERMPQTPATLDVHEQTQMCLVCTEAMFGFLNYDTSCTGGVLAEPVNLHVYIYIYVYIHMRMYACLPKRPTPTTTNIANHFSAMLLELSSGAGVSGFLHSTEGKTESLWHGCRAMSAKPQPSASMERETGLQCLIFDVCALYICV